VAVEHFVVFCQNHDQVGNRAFGDRLPGAAQPLAAFCTLLAPFVPMLFMGEEYGERAPFQFFCDHIDPEIAEATRTGRRREFAAFASFGQQIPDPQDPGTFLASKLTRARDAELARLYERLLALRRSIPPGAEAQEIAFDEDARWLRLRRGPLLLAFNFAAAERRVTMPAGASLALATHAEVRLAEDGEVVLPALAGAALWACAEGIGVAGARAGEAPAKKAGRAGR
jgi:maltooligosyltrehalose trehalohydrolase